MDARNVAPRLSTQATVVNSSDSDDEMPLLRGSTGPQDGLEQDVRDGDVPLPQIFVMSDGSCPEQRDQECHAPARPSRRLVFVPQFADATPQSIQDSEWEREAGVQTHSGFFPLQDKQLEGRPNHGCQSAESDVPRRRRRLRVVWNDDPHSGAQMALTLLQVFARRVGAVPVGAPVPVAIRQHRLSPMFVP